MTVRGAVDCIIAQTCIAAGVELLSTDRDFAAIARHTPLRLCALGALAIAAAGRPDHRQDLSRPPSTSRR